MKCEACPAQPEGRRRALLFEYGAIAQLGERVLCKHEVVGSIPSGSTSLRRLGLLRLGKPDRGEGCRAEARESEGGLGANPELVTTSSAKHHFAPTSPDGR